MSNKSRREFLKTGVAGLAALTLFRDARGEMTFLPDGDPYPELVEVTISDLQAQMKAGKLTSRRLVEMYLERIKEIDSKTHAVLELNPDALAIADSLDKERKRGKVRSPLHGIPILIKDNIDTADKMHTTAGSWALYDAPTPKQDAFVAAQLRRAGAVILGKTNLSEWANFRANGLPNRGTSGWSGRGGQTNMPCFLDQNPRGSSTGSGVSVSANLIPVAIGSETNGSIISPSVTNGIVGIKPTVGLVSRSGIIPISHSQDTAGPMARTVRDAAIVLNAIAGVDARDTATSSLGGREQIDYTKYLDANGLRGARIGVARAKFFGYSDVTDKTINDAIDAMKAHGAVIVDPANIETAGKFDDSEFDVLLYEFKADLNAYLASLGPRAPVKSLQDIIAFNEAHKAQEMPWFGQEIMTQAQGKGPLTEKKYIDELAQDLKMSRTDGIDATMTKNNLDAIVAPTGGPAWVTDLLNGDHFSGASSTPAAVAGYPNINVPAGFSHELPIGISFFGRAWSEPMLIRIAYGFEQASKQRRAPKFIPTLGVS